MTDKNNALGKRAFHIIHFPLRLPVKRRKLRRFYPFNLPPSESLFQERDHLFGVKIPAHGHGRILRGIVCGVKIHKISAGNGINRSNGWISAGRVPSIYFLEKFADGNLHRVIVLPADGFEHAVALHLQAVFGKYGRPENIGHNIQDLCCILAQGRKPCHRVKRTFIHRHRGCEKIQLLIHFSGGPGAGPAGPGQPGSQFCQTCLLRGVIDRPGLDINCTLQQGEIPIRQQVNGQPITENMTHRLYTGKFQGRKLHLLWIRPVNRGLLCECQPRASRQQQNGQHNR